MPIMNERAGPSTALLVLEPPAHAESASPAQSSAASATRESKILPNIVLHKPAGL
jgi:hypothetical protein